jgi:hypothetical protein
MINTRTNCKGFFVNKNKNNTNEQTGGFYVNVVGQYS